MNFSQCRFEECSSLISFYTLLRGNRRPIRANYRKIAIGSSTKIDQRLEVVLADALGLLGTINHDLREERAVLEQRREADLVALLDRIH